MRVGLLTPSFAGVTELGSGIGVHFRHLADALFALGHSVDVVLPVMAPRAVVIQSASAIDSASVQVVAVKKPRFAAIAGRFYWQWHQWSCERALLRAAAAAVTDHRTQIWETTSTGAMPLLALGATGRPPIVTRVSTTAAQLRSTNKGSLTWIARRHEAWERQVVHRSDALLTHSASHRTAIAEQFGVPIERIRVIPHGITIPSSPSHRNEDRIKGLYVGRLETRKGIDLLLAALLIALAQAPDLDIEIIGHDAGDAWQNVWRKNAPVSVRDRVHFLGTVPDAALADAYATSNFLVAPSRYESFGLMFAEAMSWGLPVVALAAPGALDLVEHDRTGLLVPPEDPVALAQAIRLMATNGDMRREMGRRASAHARAHWSREALAATSIAYYTDILAGSAMVSASLSRPK